ncbi:aspartate/glutamate racemase family protein [Haloferacaceae archaeon DSL9]
MFGSCARLGVIVPSSNSTVEPEFAGAVPDDVSVHAARMPLSSVTADALSAMVDSTVECAERLADADVDAVAYACTTGSLVHGRGFDAELEADIEAAAGCPAVATALSVDRALSAVRAERVAVVTPYNDDLNERERAYLTDAGFAVVSIAGRGLEENTRIGALDPDDAYEQAVSAVSSAADGAGDDGADGAISAADVDAVFVSCTNYRTLPVVERLEADLGVPVVTSNQATLWDLLRVAGVPPIDLVPGALSTR